MNEALVRYGVSGIIEALVDHQVHAGVGFTCSEAEGFRDALLELGLVASADVFMLSHAESDDVEEGDWHVVTSTDERGCALTWSRVEATEDA